MAPRNRPLSTFRLLSFDIYGTLIDWEAGIFAALQPLRSRLTAESNPSALAIKDNKIALGNQFARHERDIQTEKPDLRYDLVLKETYIRLAEEFRDPIAVGNKTDLLDKEATAFSASIALWPAFPDTVSALRRLKQRGFKLVPLSNVDHASFGRSLSGPLAGLTSNLIGNAAGNGAQFFDAAYTAQDIGSYKPSLRNFEYLVSHVKEDFGVEKDQILHVAQSLHHDHQPAKLIGLNSAWIARGEQGVSGMGGGVDEYISQGKVAFRWRFNNLAELADAVDKEVNGN